MTTVLRDRPDFAAQTAGKATFGAVGAVAMIAAGNRLIQDNGVQDPANEIAGALAADIAQAFGMTIAPNAGRKLGGSEVDDLAEAYAAQDFVVDVRTSNWGFIYFPTNWARYRVMYAASFRLVDTRSRRVIAEGSCSYLPAYTEDAPTHAELVDHEAAGLKAELGIAGKHCLEQLRSTVLLSKS